MSEKDKNKKPDEVLAPVAPTLNTPDTVDAAESTSLSRRTFVGQVGVSTAVAATSGVGIPSLLRRDTNALDWNSVAQLTQEAFRIAVNEWIGRARIQGGRVSGATAILTPGSLVSDVNIESRMLAILSPQVPPEIATPVAKVLAASWYDWAAGFQMQIPAAYPTFRAVPGSSAPPTRAAVSPALSQSSSAGEASLQSPILAKRLISSVRTRAIRGQGGTAEQAMQNLAAWVDGSFSQWKNTVTLTGLVGTGSAPTYAPPYVPVAPVISGDNVSTGPTFVGPRFGIVVP